MIYEVSLMSMLDKNSCHAKVLVTAHSERELKARLEDLTDCVEATRIDGCRWELRGHDIPTKQFNKQGLEFNEWVVTYADVVEMAYDDLEELLDGQKFEPYRSMLKCHQFLTDISGGC